ncbi:MAG: formate dehydrogenase accessory sulfurtransferase FdhD [Bacteroidetes bacterium]|nr:formate dehydrogenase accessory sulfurtransferase FdhD [Bacteroidota bacterium]
MSNISSILPPIGVAHLPVAKITGHLRQEVQDAVAIEEPLEISLEYGPADDRKTRPISITMRTPGQDADLALGFLFTEGILSGSASVHSISSTPNSIRISLDPAIIPDLARLERHFYTSSSCGVCGKSSIESLKTLPPAHIQPKTSQPLDASVLLDLPIKLRNNQDIFDSTGGLHAAALFDYNGELLTLREDIGRHNAVDKLIGQALQQARLPLIERILLLSGRACFELIQKAAMAGITIIAAVGPPSSLAVQLAEETGITLIGFLREERFNIYSAAYRIHI